MEDQRPRRHPREVLGAARAVRYAAVVLNMFDTLTGWMGPVRKSTIGNRDGPNTCSSKSSLPDVPFSWRVSPHHLVPMRNQKHPNCNWN